MDFLSPPECQNFHFLASARRLPYHQAFPLRNPDGKSRKDWKPEKLKIGCVMLPIVRNNRESWLPDIFNDFFDNSWMERVNYTAPAINVIETEKEYEVELAAPGLTKDDFQVHVDENDNLVINMEKKADKKHHGRYLRREFSYEKFQQMLSLPEDAEADKIEAKVENGVLNVTIPKKTPVEIQKAQRHIEIK